MLAEGGTRADDGLAAAASGCPGLPAAACEHPGHARGRLNPRGLVADECLAQPMQSTSLMQSLRQQTMGTGPAASVRQRVFSTNASALWRKARRSGSRAANRSAALWRQGAGLDPWRVIALLMLLSFGTAFAGARAVMAGFDESWTEIALAAARQENQALRDRQEILRAQTELTVARLEAAEATAASYAQLP